MTWVAVLVASSGAALTDTDARRFGEAVGAPARRLGPDAVEADAADSADLGALRAAFPACDVNLVPTGRRRKRLLIADMDSTMIPVECIDLVAEYSGKGAEVRAITERAMAGEIGFEESLRSRLAFAKGLPEAMLERIMTERVSLNPGARTLVRTMTAAGAHTALVSGGFTWFSERVAATAGFSEHRANRLIIESGALTGRAEEPILGREAKVAALDQMLDDRGLDHADALAVGDGANDLGMIRRAGLGVAFRAKPIVAEAAHAIIARADLTALLYLQGIEAVEWVRD